jgi:flagellar protein FliO/FliZ
MNFKPITSVTRWLLVVIGCVVLATAQPMSAASNETTAPAEPLSGQTIIYPKNAADAAKPDPAREHDSSRSLILVVALLLAAGGVWLTVQRRKAGPGGGRGGRKLQIDENRPLGNRQYLVVADYDGKKFLLGVTPGRIQMLTPLDAADTKAKEAKP